MSNGAAIPASMLDTRQAAEFLGVSVGYLAQMRSRGQRRGPRYLKAGNRVLYRLVALTEWAEATGRG